MHQKIALAALLVVPLQKAFTLDVGFPLNPTEVLATASIVMALVLFILQVRGTGLPAVVERMRPITLDRIVGTILVVANSASTTIALMTHAYGGGVPGEERAGLLDLIVYAVYGTFAIAYWLLLRGVSYAVLRDISLQSM